MQIFWLPGLLGVVLALALPFRYGLAAVIVVAPISHAYVAAAAMGVLLLRWAVMEMPRLRVSRHLLFTALVATAFLVCALVLSSMESANLLRLASESAQWVIGIGVFAAVVLSMREDLRRTILRALALSAVLLALTQSLVVALDMVPEEPGLPFLAWPNNGTSILALFGLIVLPITYPEAISKKWWLPMLVAASATIYFNESRAAMLQAALAIAGWLVLMKRDARWTLSIAALVLIGVGAAAMIVIQGVFSGAGVASLGNFQTNFSNLERLALLVYAWELFLDNPLGHGIGSSSDLFAASPYTVGSYPDSHNMLAMLAVELGWLGVLGYAAVFGFLLYRVVRGFADTNAAPLIAGTLLITTLYDELLFNGILAFYFWILLALLVATRKAEAHSYRPVYAAPPPTLRERSADMKG